MMPCKRMNSDTDKLITCCEAFNSRLRESMAGKNILAAMPAVRAATHTKRKARVLRALDHLRGSSSTVSGCTMRNGSFPTKS